MLLWLYLKVCIITCTVRWSSQHKNMVIQQFRTHHRCWQSCKIANCWHFSVKFKNCNSIYNSRMLCQVLLKVNTVWKKLRKGVERYGSERLQEVRAKASVGCIINKTRCTGYQCLHVPVFFHIVGDITLSDSERSLSRQVLKAGKVTKKLLGSRFVATCVLCLQVCVSCKGQTLKVCCLL